MASIRGYALPLQVDKKGSLVLLEDEDLIKCHIMAYLSTIKGERLGRPDYGIKDYLFDTPESIGVISSDLQKELTEKIPQAEFAVNADFNDLGELLIQVFWAYLGVQQEPFEISFLQG